LVAVVPVPLAAVGAQHPVAADVVLDNESLQLGFVSRVIQFSQSVLGLQRREATLCLGEALR
jgi:hypothetical protein